MAHKMADPADEEALTKAFSIFDQNGDGSIDPAELRAIMMNVGEPVTWVDINEILKTFDADGDGSIDLSEVHCLDADLAFDCNQLATAVPHALVNHLLLTPAVFPSWQFCRMVLSDVVTAGEAEAEKQKAGMKQINSRVTKLKSRRHATKASPSLPPKKASAKAK